MKAAVLVNALLLVFFTVGGIIFVSQAEWSVAGIWFACCLFWAAYTILDHKRGH